MAGNKIIQRSLTANMTADGTFGPINIEDLGPGKRLVITEEVNAGNVTIQPYWSADGSTWFAFGSAITEASTFPVQQALADASDQDLPAKYVKFVVTNHTSTGENLAHVMGRQLAGWA